MSDPRPNDSSGPRRTIVPLAACVLSLLLPACGLAVHAQTPEDLGAAVDRLTQAVARLGTLLEQEAAFRHEERETRRVEVAVGILGLRYRKIEQLESDIQRIAREEEEFPNWIEMMNAEMEMVEKQDRSESGQLSEGARGAIEGMEVRIRLEEDRMARLRERRLVLENDLTAAKRRLSHLEAVLDTWLDELE